MIANVQALRVLAAFLVVFVHLETLLSSLGLPPFGRSGVDIFFVVSGFVMVHATVRSRPSPIAFMTDRVIRIVPIYATLTMVVFVVAAAAPELFRATDPDPAQLLKSLLFIPFVKENGLVQPLLFVGWTLNYEMFFYALFALGLMARAYLAGVAFTAAVLAALVLSGAVFRPEGVLASFYTHPMLIEFVIGMGIGLAREHVGSIAGDATKAAVASVLVLSFASMLAAPHVWPTAPRVVFAAPLAGLVVSAAVLLDAWGWRFRRRACMALAAASYALYLSHPFVTAPIERLGRGLETDGLASTGLIALALTLVAGLALSLHQWVEKPLSAASRQLLTSRPWRRRRAVRGAIGRAEGSAPKSDASQGITRQS